MEEGRRRGGRRGEETVEEGENEKWKKGKGEVEEEAEELQQKGRRSKRSGEGREVKEQPEGGCKSRD